MRSATSKARIFNHTTTATKAHRVLRFENGNLGAHKNAGGGVWEARLDFGPGYRLYFGKDGAAVILLLAGGDKASQPKDIAAAKHYWKDFREAKHGKAQ